MVTVDCHLHLGVIDQHTPAWWWWEQFWFETVSVGGAEIIEFLDETDLDIGHYESEQFTKDLIYDLLTKNFIKFAVRLSQVNTNPIKYL